MPVRRLLPLSFSLTRSRVRLAALASGAFATCLSLPASATGAPMWSDQARLVQNVAAFSAPGQAASALPIPFAPAIPAQVDPAPPSQTQSQSSELTTFHLTTQDRHISGAMRRLASAHGWKLSWEIDRDFAIEYAASFSGSFLDVVEQIARSLQSVNTPIRVKAYHGNRVLRVLYATY